MVVASSRAVDKLIEIVLAEWRVIKSAPKAFGGAIALAAVVIWVAMDWRYGGVIDLLHEREKGFQQATETKSPEEAESKLKSLESEINRLKEDRSVSVLFKFIQWQATPENKWIALGVLRIESKYQRNGLWLDIDARNLEKFEVAPVMNQDRPNFSTDRIFKRAGYEYYFPNPNASYLILVTVPEKVDIRFKYIFDQEEKSNVITWKASLP